MTEKYQIAVVGAGPGGLSAAAHAATLEVPHVLLEKSPAVADTIPIELSYRGLNFRATL